MSANRILVVDDDPRIVRLFTVILEGGGYPVITASSGTEALEILHAETVGLVVLDLSMPEPDGFEVLKYIRSSAPGLRVLVVSGFMKGALLEAAECLGADATLDKTDAPDLLLSSVNSLMKWS